jgi:hypothetical protein
LESFFFLNYILKIFYKKKILFKLVLCLMKNYNLKYKISHPMGNKLVKVKIPNDAELYHLTFIA